jgi:predicted XRE-type DNA-binding protein
MARATRSSRDSIVESSGNVFADLGFKDAETRQTKVRLAAAIHGIIDRLGRTQAEAAENWESGSQRSPRFWITN